MKGNILSQSQETFSTGMYLTCSYTWEAFSHCSHAGSGTCSILLASCILWNNKVSLSVLFSETVIKRKAILVLALTYVSVIPARILDVENPDSVSS